MDATIRLREIMTPRVATVAPDDSMEVVRTIFTKARFHHLVVVDGDEVVGIVSDRDLFRALSPFLRTAAEQSRDRATLQRKVHQVMTRRVITAQLDTTVYEAAATMVDKSIRALPIVEDGKLVGIVSWKDILRRVVVEQGQAAPTASRGR